MFELPPKLCQERNADRPDRSFGLHVIRRQTSQLRRSVGGLRREGFRYVHRLRTTDQVDAAVVERPRPWTDRRDDAGPFDIIGDVHGCYDELVELLESLGYRVQPPSDDDGSFAVVPPEGRRALFLGDLVDRGPASDRVLHLVMDMVAAGTAVCIPGNHEAKLKRHLEGKQVKLTHGLDRTVDQLAGRSDAFRDRVADFIDGLVSHFVLDGGTLVVAHAGMREELAGRASGRVRQFALYGETTGEIDEYGLPVRTPWADEYRGRAAVVYGHTPVVEAQWHRNTLCIDTGCVFGGKLTALRWPERELVSVPARSTYYEPLRPPEPPRTDAAASPLIRLDRLLEDAAVETRFGRTVRIPPEHAVSALETLSRFTVDPRWLIHLPPTMSPSETSDAPDFLEHPAEAFAYFEKAGVERVVCEQKHMGSRALVVVGRDPETIAARFGFAPGEVDRPGIVLTRRGRSFFADAETEAAILDGVREAMESAGLFDALDTDWALWDAELMPWSAKARALLEAQYAPVGMASRTSLTAAQEQIARLPEEQRAALEAEVGPRLHAARRYVEAYRRYCWDVDRIEDYRLAPFHLLATEGAVHDERGHAWHLEQVEALVVASRSPVLQTTESRWVTLDDPAARQAATEWWLQLTEDGGEGMVVKPERFRVGTGGGLVQPALKCRGREYLRIIYGPEYTPPGDTSRRTVGTAGTWTASRTTG
ncbi:MAG: polynucleotide kinase-phosphatase, partial [Myxococcota bacterium]